MTAILCIGFVTGFGVGVIFTLALIFAERLIHRT